jgi:hypothetical protein
MAHNEHTLPRGRSLSDATLDSYADEIIGVLQIWGFSRTDAYRCSVIIKGKLQNWPNNKPWESPLKGTGLTGDQAIEGGIMKAEGAGNFSFGELGKKAN